MADIGSLIVQIGADAAGTDEALKIGGSAWRNWWHRGPSHERMRAVRGAHVLRFWDA